MGRSTEIDTLAAGLDRARTGIFVVSLEGEPGIGKSRLLSAGAEAATAAGFTPVPVAADEEIRGPFLLARQILASGSLRDGTDGPTLATIVRAHDVLAGRDPEQAGVPPDERMLRALDQAALALRSVALAKPLALLLDDVQWADTDSLRLLRYLVRTEAGLPIFIGLTLRPEEAEGVAELVNLLADLDRLGLVRRIQLPRFRQSESAELLRLALGGPVEPASAATLHAQAEGVPFVLEELARSYRDGGLLRPIDGTWILDPKAGRLLPSAIRTLLQRRSAHLAEDARAALSEAAILGRTFRLADLCALRQRLGTAACDPEALSETFRPAVAAGLLAVAPQSSGGDFRFSHEKVREYATGLLSSTRQRAIHAAIIDLLTADGDPPSELLPTLARHALAAGDPDRSARFSVAAVGAALAAHAPEEALRLVEEALPLVSARRERVSLLLAHDDALEMLRRPIDRLERLTELAALAAAAGDIDLELDVMLRRAAALRLDGQCDRASETAAEVRRRAVAAGNLQRELAACLELGQDLLRSAIGEGYVPVPGEVDLDGAASAYERAAAIAEELGDDARLAAATRELGIIDTSHLRAWFMERVRAGDHIAVLARVSRGEPLEAILAEMPVMDLFQAAGARLQRALELYERVGDRQGVMSTIIALAYLRDGASVHFGGSPAQQIEAIRRLAGQRDTLGRQTGRPAEEAQMLFSVHVFARSRVIPDLAIARGREAFARARALGDRTLEFLAAGGTAMSYLDLGQLDEAGRWIASAATCASAYAAPLRARQLETWRGLLAGAQGDSKGMRGHLERAVELATAEGRPAARCEVTATLALEAARLGAEQSDGELLALAETSAAEARRLANGLPGHPLWPAQAEAAGAICALHRGDPAGAADHGRLALDIRRAAQIEDPHLELLLPAARAIVAGGSAEERQSVLGELQLVRALIAQRTLDEAIRIEWLGGPLGRELSRLAGGASVPALEGASLALGTLDERDQRVVQLLSEGLTNAEIAAALGLSPAEVDRLLMELYARIAVASRSDATALALRDESAR